MKDLNRILRPESWDDIVGQHDIVSVCRQAIIENRFPRFSIFHGPTGVGKSCIAELIARELTGVTGDIANSPAIKKYNMASLVSKKDIVEIIESIFKYKTVQGTCVYILEEVQVLRQKEDQTPFLEELTKIPDNVYIIMCTTKISSLLIEMRNRAVPFQLTLPTYSDCEQLIQNVLDKMHFAPISAKAMSVLIKSSDYTPRSIIKYIELLASNGIVQEDEVNKFFKVVGNTFYIKTLAALTDNRLGLYDAVTQFTTLLENQSVQNFLYGFRDFCLQYIIERAAGKKQLTISTQERKLCTELLSSLDENMFAKVFEAMSKLDIYHFESSNDVLAFLIRMKLSISNKSAGDIMKTNKALASEAFVANKRAVKNVKPVSSTEDLVPITSASNLAALGLEDDTIYEE